MFGKKLNELRKEKGLTQKELADLLGVKDRTIGHYESGRNEPDNETMVKIADFFNVSTDYLLGRSDIRNPFGQMTIAAHKTDPFADLSPVNIEKINSFIKFIRNENNEKK